MLTRFAFAITLFIILLPLIYLWYSSFQNYTLSNFPVGTVTIGNKSWNAYIALTPLQQGQGYMYQHSIGNCNGRGNCIGMLFPMNSTQNICMWMHNTPIPLHQYWIENNRIVYAYNGLPFSNAVICHLGNAVLETNESIPLNSSVYFNYR
ncbi:MAG: DUF192 domain-containing protein [Candidatus Micrarchaeia archaeon]